MEKKIRDIIDRIEYGDITMNAVVSRLEDLILEIPNTNQISKL